jgi:hypothetical protein
MQSEMFSSDTLARLRAHRSNIARYRKLLESPLTDLERGFIERRLNEEKEAAEALFPVPAFLKPRSRSGRLHDDVDVFVARGHEKVIAYYTWFRDTAQVPEERAGFQERIEAIWPRTRGETEVRSTRQGQ